MISRENDLLCASRGSSALTALVACPPEPIVSPFFEWCRTKGLSLLVCHSGVQALQGAERGGVALLALGDLPDTPHSQVVQALRRMNVSAPVLHIGGTPHAHEPDHSLAAPFSARGLFALLDRIWRAQPTHREELGFGPVRVNLARQELRVDDAVKRLPKKRFDLLVYLMTNVDRSVSIEELALKTVGTLHGDPRRIPKDIHAVRCALGEARSMIERCPRGYRFVSTAVL